MGENSRKMSTNLAIFASGSGTNAENIISSFKDDPKIEVKLVLSNKPNAGVLHRAKKLGVPSKVFDRNTFYQSDEILDLLKSEQVDWIILAGFLWLVPANLLQAFPDKIINIHPALLPAYGGKGMYGEKVHQAVIENKEKASGITIHLVNEKYDEGRVLFQASCEVESFDTPDSLASKIHQLEYKYFPSVIRDAVLGQL